MSRRHHPLLALAILSGLNFFNYVDRYVLFAVVPLLQQEFPRSDADYGFLTTAFFLCYMFTAPVVGFLADRYSRKWLMIGGAMVWSVATLMTAITYDFETLLIRHTIVGLGEATFVTIAPSFLADLFSEDKRGRVFGWFYLNIGLGAAAGYMLGGSLGHHFGWRFPFYVAAAPGFLLAIALIFLPEPRRGEKDLLKEAPERSNFWGLFRNGAFWTASLGMAMVTFALGGMSAWMPTFLYRTREIPLAEGNLIFGAITAVTSISGTLIGGWLGDRLLTRSRSAYYLVSAVTLLIGVPAMLIAIYTTGPLMYPAIFVAEFLLFLNTAPLNAAVVNSVGASIRATAIAVNLFTIHLLGDAASPRIIGEISDRSSLQTGFLSAVAAVLLGVAVLFFGMKYAPQLPPHKDEGVTA
ncbi:MAG TPA: MFS transporter [Terriglobales bacterium]|nr:MFS transporter [Terriglobales bacterium]